MFQKLKIKFHGNYTDIKYFLEDNKDQLPD